MSSKPLILTLLSAATLMGPEGYQSTSEQITTKTERKHNDQTICKEEQNFKYPVDHGPCGCRAVPARDRRPSAGPAWFGCQVRSAGCHHGEQQRCYDP